MEMWNLGRASPWWATSSRSNSCLTKVPASRSAIIRSLTTAHRFQPQNKSKSAPTVCWVHHTLILDRNEHGVEQREVVPPSAPVVIEDHVWIGSRAIILPGVCIGQHSVVGAGSVVTKDIPANCLAVVNPARVVRRFDRVRDDVAGAPDYESSLVPAMRRWHGFDEHAWPRRWGQTTVSEARGFGDAN